MSGDSTSIGEGALGLRDGIAIIGMAGRFPGAQSVDELWRNLRGGVESITRFTDEELAAAGVDRTLREHPRYVKARAELSGVELFDAAFFGYSPREAESIDPQQRLFLECAWEALERAGYDPARVPGSVGLFGGAGADGYLLNHLMPHRALLDTLGGLAAYLGNEKDHLTTRVAYKLGLRGPSITVQTACSTALVAVQLACQSLLGYQCDMALAGGVSIAFPLHCGYLYQEGHILSPDGHCRAFDAEARGTVPGDGVGIVVLKRLDEALADGDHIHAVIRGAAVNNDGALKMGYTAPSVDGQADVITMAHAMAGVTADTIGYIETHGTGTALGDPIEIAALTQAFRGSARTGRACAIGSLKTNIGHLNTAAGIASLIKATLALEHRFLPPSLHYRAPNPEIDFEHGPFRVVAEGRPWNGDGAPRRAGVSAFGFGGTNAHVVLEEAPPVARDASPATLQLLVLSARSPAARDAASDHLRAYLELHPETPLADVAFTLQMGRSPFPWRRAILCRDSHQAIEALGNPNSTRRFDGNPAQGAPAIGPLETEPSVHEDALGEGGLTAVARSWLAGAPVDWSACSGALRRRRVPLPTYPFERQRYFIVPPPGAQRIELAPAPLDGGRGQPSETGFDRHGLDEAEIRIRRELAIRPLESYPDLEPQLERLCAAYLVDYLRTAGIDTRPGASCNEEDLKRRLRILPRFERLFQVLIGDLVRDGILRGDGDVLRFTQVASELPSPADQSLPLRQRYPQFDGLLDFLAHCVASYPDSLSGGREAIGVLYPGGNTQWIDRVERDTVEYRDQRIWIQLLCEAVVARVKALRGRPARILEVGGGQGLLTWPLVTALAGEAFEYHFTDLGRVFVDDARAEALKRGVSDRMRFAVLDASREPGPQGYEEAGFDVVIAFNVVHATPRIAETLRHLESLLASGGTLGLVEVIRTRRWDTMTWGLADGWWYYEDEIRRDSPLLDLATWEEVVRTMGLDDIESFPAAPEARARADHGLILARRARPSSPPAPSPAVPRKEIDPFPILPARHPRPDLSSAYVAPRNSIERRIAALAEELLGIDRIGVQDDFFVLGADSLLTLRLTDRVGQELGRELPPSAAFKGSTVERMARALAGDKPTDGGGPLVAIQPGGDHDPLFFVHPAAGVVFPYFELARQLGPNQPFFAFQALGLDGESTPDTRIADMARHYIEAMRRVQPRGPYRLGGFSFGCLVAFEMAQQLRAAGERTELLALVDEPAPIAEHRPSPWVMGRVLATGIAKSIWPHLHDYFYLRSASRGLQRRRPEGDLLQSFLARSTMANFVPRESRLLLLRQPAVIPMFELFLIHLRETLRYPPRAYPDKITLFTTRLGTRLGKDPTLGWNVLAAGGVEVHDVPGEHLTVLRPPHVEVLAAKLKDCLKRSASPR